MKMVSYPPGQHPKGFVKSEKQFSSINTPPIKKKPKKGAKRSSFKAKSLKILIWIGVIIALYLYYAPLKQQAIHLLQLNSTVWEIYSTMSAEITAKTLLGLFLTSFFGAIFFISIPVELVFLYYLTLSFNVWEVLLFVMIGNMLGMIVNYFFGFLIGPRLLRKWLKEKYEKWQKTTARAGGFVLIFGNIIPFPIELITVFIGGVKYPYTKFVVYTFIGKLIKFGLLYFGYIYFSETLTTVWQDALLPWLLYMYESYIAPVEGLF